MSVVCPGVIATPIIEHTRFRGAQARPENVARLRGAFARRGHPPEAVARAVIDAVARNRAVVPVGPEAWAGWFLRWARAHAARGPPGGPGSNDRRMTTEPRRSAP